MSLAGRIDGGGVERAREPPFSLAGQPTKKYTHMLAAAAAGRTDEQQVVV